MALVSSWGTTVAEVLVATAEPPCSHEFTGVVTEVGSAVKNFKKGDQIVSPFTVSWSVDICLLDGFLTKTCQHGMLLLQEWIFVKM